MGKIEEWKDIDGYPGYKISSFGRVKSKDRVLRRKQSERYGFVVPLRYDLHEFGKDSVHENPNAGLDLKLKQMAQEYWESHYGNRQAFIETFGKNYL